MDLSVLQELIPDLSRFLNIEPATLLLYLGLIATICNVAGRLIPDDKTGFLGVVRDVCKALGVYTPNRVTTGVTVNDVVRSVVSRSEPEVTELAEQPGTLIQEVNEATAASPPPPAFPGLVDAPRDENGRFVKREKGSAI